MLCTVMATLCHSWHEVLQKLERGARENITLFSLLKNIIMQEPLVRKLEGFRHKYLQSRRDKQLMENSRILKYLKMDNDLLTVVCVALGSFTRMF